MRVLQRLGSVRVLAWAVGAVGIALLAGTSGARLAGWAQAQAPALPPVYLPLAQRAFVPPFPIVPTAPPPTVTPTDPPTATVTLSPEPSPTATPTPTETPTLAPTATATPVPLPWLARLNHHRGLARLAPVIENADWSRGGELHSRYMVKNDIMSHSEQRSNQWSTAEGAAAGENGNVQVSSELDKPVPAAIDYWMTLPFHQIAMLDPQLRVSGYGEWRENIGTFHFGATLDVLRGRSAAGTMPRFPVRYPEMDTVFPLRAYEGVEVPDPLTSCSGYSVPTGPPLVLMLGAGDVTPKVTGATVTDAAGTVLPSCWFDQTNYRNGNRSAQDTGRAVLAMRSAVIVMPRSPLAFDARYTVRIVNDGTAHTWSFRTAPDTTPPFTPMPPVDQAKEDEVIRLINQQRQQAGLAPYRVDPRLTHAARRHSRDMAANDRPSHTGSDGSTPESRIRDTGYGNCVFSADFAFGWGGDPALVVASWMNDPGARAHILSDKREVGLGYAANPATSMVHFFYIYYATRQ